MRFLIFAVSILMMGMQTNVLPTYSTANFHIRYEKNIPKVDVRKLGEHLETQVAEYQRRFGVTLTHKLDVSVYSSLVRFRSESRSRMFDDGCYADGQICLMSPKALEKKMILRPVISRVVGRALLAEIGFCPPWLGECYSLYLGNDLTRFGRPAQVKVGGFADVGEQFASAQREKELREVYAILSVTADFFVTRYGEKRVEEMLALFKQGGTIEEVIESAFGEKLSVIEKAWLDTLRMAVKE